MLKTFYKNRRPEEGKKKLWNNILFHNFFAFLLLTYAFIAFFCINPELKRILRTNFVFSFCVLGYFSIVLLYY